MRHHSVSRGNRQRDKKKFSCLNVKGESHRLWMSGGHLEEAHILRWGWDRDRFWCLFSEDLPRRNTDWEGGDQWGHAASGGVWGEGGWTHGPRWAWLARRAFRGSSAETPLSTFWSLFPRTVSENQSQRTGSTKLSFLGIPFEGNECQTDVTSWLWKTSEALLSFAGSWWWPAWAVGGQAFLPPGELHGDQTKDALKTGGYRPNPAWYKTQNRLKILT